MKFGIISVFNAIISPSRKTFFQLFNGILTNLYHHCWGSGLQGHPDFLQDLQEEQVTAPVSTEKKSADYSLSCLLQTKFYPVFVLTDKVL